MFEDVLIKHYLLSNLSDESEFFTAMSEDGFQYNMGGNWLLKKLLIGNDPMVFLITWEEIGC